MWWQDFCRVKESPWGWQLLPAHQAQHLVHAGGAQCEVLRSVLLCSLTELMGWGPGALVLLGAPWAAQVLSYCSACLVLDSPVLRRGITRPVMLRCHWRLSFPSSGLPACSCRLRVSFLAVALGDLFCCCQVSFYQSWKITYVGKFFPGRCFPLGKKSASAVGTTGASCAEVTRAALSKILCCERLQDKVCICKLIGQDAECLQLPLALDSWGCSQSCDLLILNILLIS